MPCGPTIRYVNLLVVHKGNVTVYWQEISRVTEDFLYDPSGTAHTVPMSANAESTGRALYRKILRKIISS